MARRVAKRAFRICAVDAIITQRPLLHRRVVRKQAERHSAGGAEAAGRVVVERAVGVGAHVLIATGRNWMDHWTARHTTRGSPGAV